MRAAIALARHKPGEAIEALKPAAATEMGASQSPINTLYGALYPVYFRGLALCAQGRGAEAVLEFQRIIAHSGIVVSDPVGALAHLQLARSYRQLGDLESSENGLSVVPRTLEGSRPGDPVAPPGPGRI
jgi:eukaryotic-like serine/threonine-protein kinase